MNTSHAMHPFLLDRKGSSRAIELQIGEELPIQPETLLWVHIDYSRPEAEEWLRACKRPDPLAVESLLGEASRPRSLLFHNGLLLDLRGINLNPDAAPEDMVAIRIWMDEQCIISSNRRRLQSLEDLREALKAGNGPTSSGEFLTFLVGRLAEHTAEVIERLEDTFDTLEDNLFTSENTTTRPELSEIRILAIRLRRYLAPQKEALSHLLLDPPAWLNKRDRLHLKESINNLNRHIEELDAIRDRANIAQEEILSRMSEQLNRRMYTLALVATLFMPLGFLTGLLGINVGGIPGANSSLGFITVSLIIAVLITLQLLYLKKKKWF